MTKVVWLPNETDYSYCEFVVPNTSYNLVYMYLVPRVYCVYTKYSSIQN